MELEKGRWEGGRGTLAEYTDQPLLLYQLYPRDRDLGKGEFHQIGIVGGVSRVSIVLGSWKESWDIIPQRSMWDLRTEGVNDMSNEGVCRTLNGNGGDTRRTQNATK